MLALYRSGRQAEALSTFERARQVLVDELGADPSPELQRLHERILDGDPALGTPARGAPEPARPKVRTSRVDLQPGTEVAGYRIERTLGRGGMSVVYLAEHDWLQRKVALKVLAPQLAEDERFRERFVRESRLAASLDHPNVIPIYEAGASGGDLFIAMRYVEGTDLRTLLAEQGPLPLERAVHICAQVADALQAAHERGLVHRDVKPANILIGRSDHAYLSDFGLIRRTEVTGGITKTGQFMGTLDYASPEQFEGKPLGPPTDVYSLGCVLFECLVGEPPFRREQDAAVMYAHLHDPPPSARARRPELTRGLIAGVGSQAVAASPSSPSRRRATGTRPARRAGVQRLEPGTRWNRTPWCQSVKP
jgi:serine/threonine protein kinase